MSIKTQRLLTKAKKLVKSNELDKAKEIYLFILESFPNNNEANATDIFTKKVEIKISGDSSYLPGEIIDRIKFDNANEKLKSEGKTPVIIKI